MIEQLVWVDIAVRDAPKAADLYKDLFGLRLSHIIPVAQGGARVHRAPVGNSNLDFTEPLGPQGPIHRFLERRGEGLYQIGFMVKDLEPLRSRLQARDIPYRESASVPGGHLDRLFPSPQHTYGALLMFMDSVTMRGEVDAGPPLARKAALEKLLTVSVAVRDLARAQEVFSYILGLEPARQSASLAAGVRSAWLPVKDISLVLVEPLGPDSPVQRFLDRRGEGLYDITFRVADADAAYRELQAKGVPLVAPTMREGKVRRFWVHPRASHGVLMELTQEAGG